MSTDRTGPEIERGTYEIIRDRLIGHGKTLAGRAEELNHKRIELFGGTELAVVANERIRTENNCVPRDIAVVGDHLLFGYNVFIGLKRETRVEDVFRHLPVRAQGSRGTPSSASSRAPDGRLPR